MKCLVTKCTSQEALALKRGLCMKCYSTAKKLVDSGATTWQRLIDMGMAKDDGSDLFTTQFLKNHNQNEGPG